MKCSKCNKPKELNLFRYRKDRGIYTKQCKACENESKQRRRKLKPKEPKMARQWTIKAEYEKYAKMQPENNRLHYQTWVNKRASWMTYEEIQKYVKFVNRPEEVAYRNYLVLCEKKWLEPFNKKWFKIYYTSKCGYNMDKVLKETSKRDSYKTDYIGYQKRYREERKLESENTKLLREKRAELWITIQTWKK